MSCDTFDARVVAGAPDAEPQPRDAGALLSQAELQSIAELSVLQNVELSSADARQLARLQSDFLRSSLSRGFADLGAYLRGARGGMGMLPGRATFCSIVEEVASAATTLRRAVGADAWPRDVRPGEVSGLQQAAQSLQQCYERIHAVGTADVLGPGELWSDRDLLFLEFLTGLCMAWLAAEVHRIVLLDLLRAAASADPAELDPSITDDLATTLTSIKLDTHGASQSIHAHASMIMDFASIVDVVYLDNLIAVSNDAVEHVYSATTNGAFLDDVSSRLDARPELLAVMQIVCSMRYIPPDDPKGGIRRAASLGMAQVLHWNGIGSDDGGIWLEHECLSLLAHYALAFADNFSSACVVSEAVEAMRHHAREATTRFLLRASSSADGVGVPPKGARLFRILEDASGRTAQVAREIADGLHAELHPSGGAMVYVCTADGVGSNLASLADAAPAPHFRVSSVRYRDLTLAMVDEPRHAAPRDVADRYDAYVVGLALHHVTDGQLGLHFYREIIRFGTRAVRPGGCLCFSELTDWSPVIEMIVPLDLVDRVGRIPLDLHRTFTFASLATDTGRIDAEGGRLVKIPYEMRSFSRHLPSAKRPIFAFVLLVVVEVPEPVVAELDELRAQDAEHRIDEIIRRHADLDALEAPRPERTAEDPSTFSRAPSRL